MFIHQATSSASLKQITITEWLGGKSRQVGDFLGRTDGKLDQVGFLVCYKKTTQARQTEVKQRAVRRLDMPCNALKRREEFFLNMWET